MTESGAGIYQRHTPRCPRDGPCDCPWEAWVYVPDDRRKKRRIFYTEARAKAWRQAMVERKRREKEVAILVLTPEELHHLAQNEDTPLDLQVKLWEAEDALDE